MESSEPPNLPRLRGEVEAALRRALDASEVLPMLHRLARAAAPGSDERVFANRQLAELLAERNPWRAALYARRVIADRPEDDRGWALLGLSQTLLGHYRFAVAAYQRALERSPANPWYAHNLGHLLDVALDRAGDALEWLRSAYDGAASLGHAENGDIAASLAHALARAGKLKEAKGVLTKAMKRGGSREHSALMKWLDKGAPADEDAGAGPHATTTGERRARTKRVREKSTKEGARTRAVESALARGLERLPLDTKLRAKARSLAKSIGPELGNLPGTADSVAAAIAYAVTAEGGVPLTQSEVAATFRVSVAALRGRFDELRGHLGASPTRATREH